MKRSLLIAIAVFVATGVVACASRTPRLRPAYGRVPLWSGWRDHPRLRVGVAKVALLEGLEFPVQMATYGPRPGTAHGVREPVFARAIVLETQPEPPWHPPPRLAIVSSDLLISDAELSEAVRARLHGSYHTILVATHTHTSIGGYVDRPASEYYIMGPFSPAMREHLAKRIATAIEQAADSLEDAHAGVGATTAHYSANRRLGTTTDDEVGILRFARPDGSPLAVVVNWAGHPILEPRDGTISADYPGILCRHLDERFGFGMFLPGALGDLNARADPEREEWVTAGLAERVAQGLFDAIEPVVETIPTQDGVKLWGCSAPHDLPELDVGLVPNLLWPLDAWMGSLLKWPRRFTVQAAQIGDLGIVATSSEAVVRLGLEIKSRSPMLHTWVVVHAEDYTGYAIHAADWAKSKLDATSIPSVNGPRHGTELVEACLLPLYAIADRRMDAVIRPQTIAAPEDDIERTTPQSRARLDEFADTWPDRVRLEASAMWLGGARGGAGQRGRRSEVTLGARVELPLELRLGARGSWVDTHWTAGDADGASDVDLWLERPITLSLDGQLGNAWRIVPHAGLGLPTGDHVPGAPLAFSPGTGVLRPFWGIGLERTWNTYQTAYAGVRHRTAIDRDTGRRPGEDVEASVGYRERHGLTSLGLDLVARVRAADSRTAGRTAADVPETSFDLAIRPGISVLFTEHFEAFVRGLLPIARGGAGGGEGLGVSFGMTAGF